MTRAQKFDAVHDLAKLLVAQGRTNTFDDLGAWLNRQGLRHRLPRRPWRPTCRLGRVSLRSQ
jgi:hypothetical protein